LTSLIPQNDPVDVALDRAGAVREGEAVEHGGVVLSESACEGVQVGLVVGLDSGDPGVEAVDVAAGEDFSELVPSPSFKIRSGSPPGAGSGR
jgi:hypothetical protein